MRNLFIHNIILYLFCGFIVFSGCSLETSSARETLEISLPQWPPQDDLKESYPPLSRWLIQISCADRQEKYFTEEKTIIVQTNKNHPFCITATPITLLQNGSECSYFNPAGFIYPTGCEKTISADISADWNQGFLAHTMQRLFKSGLEGTCPPQDLEYLISTFNWNKTQKTINEKISSSSEHFYNPWLLSQTKIIEGIVSQNFKSSLLNLTGTTTLDTNLILSRTVSSETSYNLFSSFIPENNSIIQKKQFTLLKNTPILIADAKKYGLFINYKSLKNISVELIYLPIYIGDT